MAKSNLLHYKYVEQLLCITLWNKDQPKFGNISLSMGLIAEERREVKIKGERERYTQLNAEFQRIVGRDEKAMQRNKGKQ